MDEPKENKTVQKGDEPVMEEIKILKRGDNKAEEDKRGEKQARRNIRGFKR